MSEALATLVWVTHVGAFQAGISGARSLMVRGCGVVGAALILGESAHARDWIAASR
jgi:hypothetical protein